ncbi:MAG: tetratricopeptide repeat protein, partial [Betaproteobacteria bacterium]
WTALSYAQQADFKLEDALASAKRAVQLNPNSSPARSRVAELLMSLGRTREAQRAAEAAVDANPRDSRAHSVLGFVYLTQIDTANARLEFQAAIEYDSADPLARLGMGLAMIRRGELVAGREQIEIAVTLDPTNALIRSYMGKAYFEEDTGPRDRLATSQLGMAKQLDPSDPTPWFYDALLKSTENRPVEALQDVQRSIKLNDQRAVYRSRLLLDEDLAARSASLARVYSDLNFQQLAQVEGWNSLAADPTNFSAHRFLADSYLGEPRHEIGRLSELLQSQLWQPLNLQPLQPQIGETGLSITNGLGPARTSYDEYTNLFVRNGLRVYANGIVGSNDTFGDDLVVSGLQGPLSFSLGQFHYQSQGYRANNDQKRDLYNAFVQFAVSPETSVQAEYRTQRSDFGDLNLRFDPNRFNANERHVQNVDTARVGIRHDFSASTQMIAVVLGQQSTDDQHSVTRSGTSPFIFETAASSSSRQSAGVGEFQLVNRWDSFRLITGGGYFNSENDGVAQAATRRLFPAFVFPTVIRPIDQNTNQTSAYSYATYTWSALAATLGLSVNYYESLAAQGTQVNPKLGLIWKAAPTTTIRFAAFRSLRRDLVSNQTIEPTQIAGFDQFYDDPAAADAKRIGIGIDQVFARTLFGGIEVSKRNIGIPVSAINSQNRGQAREWLDRAYVYWTPTERMGLRAEYQYDQRERDSNLFLGGFDYRYLRTQRVPLQASWFAPSGWAASITTTWTDQAGKFFDTIAQRNSAGHDEFWLVDAEVRYRLPRRYGMVSVGVKNLFDTHFNFQEPDPTNPTVYPERFVYLKLEASF